MLHPDTAYTLYRQQEKELAKRLRMRAERECCAEPRKSLSANWAAAVRSAMIAVGEVAGRGRDMLRSVAASPEGPACCPAVA